VKVGWAMMTLNLHFLLGLSKYSDILPEGIIPNQPYSGSQTGGRELKASKFRIQGGFHLTSLFQKGISTPKIYKGS